MDLRAICKPSVYESSLNGVAIVNDTRGGICAARNIQLVTQYRASRLCLLYTLVIILMAFIAMMRNLAFK